MAIDEAYNAWAASYDNVVNKTRDLEKMAAQQTLKKYRFGTVLELGCGTGKNTEWMAEISDAVFGLDFSPKMLAKAKQKIKAGKVQFLQADLTKAWNIEDNSADLITCSLTLEHIENLHFIFSEAFKKLKAGGWFYICELHPFKQYKGSKARFETETGMVELDVFIHHVSEYVQAALASGFKLVELREWFDENEQNEVPRLISFVFEKP